MGDRVFELLFQPTRRCFRPEPSGSCRCCTMIGRRFLFQWLPLRSHSPYREHPADALRFAHQPRGLALASRGLSWLTRIVCRAGAGRERFAVIRPLFRTSGDRLRHPRVEVRIRHRLGI